MKYCMTMAIGLVVFSMTNMPAGALDTDGLAKCDADKSSPLPGPQPIMRPECDPPEL